MYDPRYRGWAIPVIFGDGSEPDPFPVGCLAAPGALPPTEGPVRLKLGLMSFRHPEMDYMVDLYVSTNVELADESSMAAEEDTSYRNALALLSDPSLEGGALIEVYHTRLEPMVVGFYRAVVEVLRRRAAKGRPRTLVIQPRMLAAKGTRENLTPESPGALSKHYRKCMTWY